MPAEWSAHSRERLAVTLAPFRRDGTLPDYPLGSDFTGVEQRIVRALAWLQARTGSRRGKLATVAAALAHGGGPRDDEALVRMALAAPRGIGERIEARLLRLALARTQASG